MITYIINSIRSDGEWQDCGILTADGEVREAKVRVTRPMTPGPLFVTIDLNGHQGNGKAKRRLENTKLMMGNKTQVTQEWCDRLHDYIIYHGGVCETARRIGCSSSSLSRILNGQRPTLKYGLKEAIDRVIDGHVAVMKETN